MDEFQAKTTEAMSAFKDEFNRPLTEAEYIKLAEEYARNECAANACPTNPDDEEIL